MWSQRISSGSKEHPTPKDVVRAVLTCMIEKSGSSSWAHFEVISEGGWFGNLFSGKKPWVEVAYMDERSLQLNLGVDRKKEDLIPKMPEKWTSSGKGLWTVPISNTEALNDWVDGCLAAVSGRLDYHVSGWIDGS